MAGAGDVPGAAICVWSGAMGALPTATRVFSASRSGTDSSPAAPPKSGRLGRASSGGATMSVTVTGRASDGLETICMPMGAEVSMSSEACPKRSSDGPCTCTQSCTRLPSRKTPPARWLSATQRVWPSQKSSQWSACTPGASMGQPASFALPSESRASG